MKEYRKIKEDTRKKEVFSVRFQKECERLNKSVNQIERELGYPRNALHNYKNGAIPSGNRLVKIAKYFDVTPQYLIGETDYLNDEELKEYFQGLSFENKKELCKITQKWLYSYLIKEEK